MPTNDFNEQLMRRLDTLDRNISTIIATSSANGATLAGVQNELSAYRALNHDRFDNIQSKLVTDEGRLNTHEKRISTLEQQAYFAYKVLTVIGTLGIVILGWFTEAFHKVGTLFLPK